MQIITEKTLATGLRLAIVDHSRPLAADRWNLRVVGHLYLPVRLEDYTGLASDDLELDSLARQRLGDLLEYQLVRERHFVDGGVKDELIQQLTAQLLDVVARYLDDANFPVRLLAVKYREIRDLCALERLREIRPQEAGEEPADFSHCFK